MTNSARPLRLLLLTAFFCLPFLAMSQENDLPHVLSQVENGWVNIKFSVLEHRPIEKDGKYIGDALMVGGMWDGQTVRFHVGIPAEWDEAKMTPSPLVKSWSTPISFMRAGVSSDRFVKSLARRYEVPDAGLQAREEVEFDALSLFEDPRPFGAKPIRLKLFVVKDGKLSVGEVYLAIDLKRKIVELNEQDPEYRTALIDALATRQ